MLIMMKKAEFQRVRSNRIRTKRYGMSALVLLATFLIGMTGQEVSAANDRDFLYVTGVIKSVNAKSGMVTVDVVSSSCLGMRIFTADKIEKLEAVVGQKVSFFINSSRCDVKEVYTILVSRGLRK